MFSQRCQFFQNNSIQIQSPAADPDHNFEFRTVEEIRQNEQDRHLQEWISEYLVEWSRDLIEQGPISG